MSESEENFTERVPMTWYKCRVCLGWLHSIPKLKEHSATKHPNHRLVLPNNLPPGAEEGKIYYDDPALYGPAPKQYPYSQLIATWDEGKNTSVNSDAAPLSLPSPDPGNCGIWVRSLEDITEHSVEECHVNQAEEQRKSPSPPNTPLVSPPDSGIQIGSEYQEEEFQQPQPAQISSVATRFPEKRSYASVVSSETTTGDNVRFPTTSTAGPSVTNKRKFTCLICQKKFSNVPSLNFHLKNFHPEKQSQQIEPNLPAPVPHSAKVILKIQRDSTGNLTSKSGGNEVGSQIVEQQSTPQITTRARRLSVCSSEVSACTTAVVPRLRPLPKLRKTLNEILENKTKEKEVATLETQANQTSEERVSRVQTDNRMEATESDSDSKVMHRTRLKSKRNPVRIESSHSGSDSDEKKSETSEFTPPRSRPKIKRRKLPKRASRKEKINSAATSPEPRYQTRSRRTKMKSPTPSPSTESGSENESSQETEDEKSSESNEEEEMSEKSTTSEEGSLPPPELTKYGTSDEDTNKSIKSKGAPVKATNSKEKPVEEKDHYSTSDSNDDLFVAVVVKKKKKNKYREDKGETSNKVKVKNEDDKVVILNCTFCSDTLTRPPMLVSHLYEKHKNENKSYNCGYCHRTFNVIENSYEDYNDHDCPKRDEANQKQN